MAFHEVLPKEYREALRSAAIVYLDECYAAVQRCAAGERFAEMDVAAHLPPRYAHYYDGLFAKEWTTTVAVVGWKLSQRERPMFSCLAEELALNALIREAEVQLELHGGRSDHARWGDFRDWALEDQDFLYLFDPAFDGIEDDAVAKERFTFVGLPFAEWFMPFNAPRNGAPHPYCVD